MNRQKYSIQINLKGVQMFDTTYFSSGQVLTNASDGGYNQKDLGSYGWILANDRTIFCSHMGQIPSMFFCHFVLKHML